MRNVLWLPYNGPMTNVTKNVNQAQFTDEDIKILAQAFDVLLEGAIQTGQISQNGKVPQSEGGDGND